MRSLTGFACPLCLFIDNIQKRAEKNKFLDVGEVPGLFAGAVAADGHDVELARISVLALNLDL